MGLVVAVCTLVRSAAVAENLSDDEKLAPGRDSLRSDAIAAVIGRMEEQAAALEVLRTQGEALTAFDLMLAGHLATVEIDLKRLEQQRQLVEARYALAAAQVARTQAGLFSEAQQPRHRTEATAVALPPASFWRASNAAPSGVDLGRTFDVLFGICFGLHELGGAPALTLSCSDAGGAFGVRHQGQSRESIVPLRRATRDLQVVAAEIQALLAERDTLARLKAEIDSNLAENAGAIALVVEALDADAAELARLRADLLALQVGPPPVQRGPLIGVVDVMAVPVHTASGRAVPAEVVRAVQAAEAQLALEAPDCGVSWPLLAAISEVESAHGSYGGAVVGADGRVHPTILGPPLDGAGVAYVADTDAGRLDGDRTLDRAVGPMQFLPQTWASFGRDGDGDGLAEPSNYFDAALSAADYLCRSGGSLTDPAGLATAVFAYNHSAEYVSVVLGTAEWYAAFTAAPSVPS